jgi:predicted polyphosphate/ATP-dependent NAD kinase
MGISRLGLIVNPVAGLGGRVGLKGSDGTGIQQRAREMGAVPQASRRAVQALERLRNVPDLEVITYPGEMGEDAVKTCGLKPTVIGSITPGTTTAQDTIEAAREMRRLGVDLLLFAGGDGTARDIYRAVGEDLPALGIPAGVKIHSAVYATSPANAGSLAALYLAGRVTSLEEAEVMDIDEEAFRSGSVSAKLYGYLKIPFRASLVQSQKMASIGGSGSLTAIAEDIVERMEFGILYIIGPGTTTRAIAIEMGAEKTLLGVDVYSMGQSDRQRERRGHRLLADANETELLDLLKQGRQFKVIVTLIGGQGFIFGRGNQQISPKVLRKLGVDPADPNATSKPWQNIIVVGTKEKLYTLGSEPLRVDTGDPTLDKMLSGYVTVVTGYRERAVRRVSGG